MATEHASVPVNGTFDTAQSHPYPSQEQSHTATSASTTSATSTQQSSSAQDIPKEEVAWYFVEQYYTTLSRSPDKLYLFFNKRSQLVAGEEDEKVPICAGQKAIKERIAEFNFKDTKVRVTNVDSQASDANIVIQVIGELSNDSAPHRKFVQTFVLAGQTNGYFVLNDIFRYIKDEEEEPEAEELQHDPTTIAGGFQEPAPTAEEPALKGLAASKDTVVPEEAAAQVDKELEEVIRQEEAEAKESHPPAEVNGTPVPEEVEVAHAEEAPAAAVPAPETEPNAEVAEPPAAEEEVKEEKPKEPAPTPAAPAKTEKPAVPAGPPKPVVPKTWAQMMAGGRSAAAAATAAIPASAPAAQPKATQPTQVPSAPAQSQAPAPAVAPPAREPSPAEGSQEGSQGGWQTAGADHSRKQSRAQAQVPSNNGQVRAYVKNVYPTVDANELKVHLSKYGELAYFDVSRQKNSAFVEFVTRAGFEAAVAANPHKLGSENIYVEERRMQGPPGQRGSFRGGPGRGGFDSRGRGSFGGPRGRGAPPPPRGARGGAQAA